MPFLYHITPHATRVTVFEVHDTLRETLHDAKIYQIDLPSKLGANVCAGLRESNQLSTDPGFIDKLIETLPVLTV